MRHDIAQVRVENLVRPRGGITCGYDASSLFDDGRIPEGWGSYNGALTRLKEVHLTNFGVRYAAQVGCI